MGKDNTKNLVGQPIFKQIIKMIPKDRFDALVVQQKSDKGYRTFFHMGAANGDALWHIFPLRFDGGSMRRDARIRR